MKKIRCAVVGVGYLGRFHAQKYAQLPQAELVAVSDNDAARAAEIAREQGVQAYTDYQSLLGQVDAVSIATPTLSHYAVASFFLSHGIHTLVEKPITTTVEEANALIALAHEKNCILQVGHLERFNSAVLALEGILDHPRFMECQRIAPFTPRGADVNVILDLMIHDIDLILGMVRSPVKTISANGAPILTQQIDIANARLQFENGCVANVTASRAGLKTERRLRIFQSDAYISVNLHEKKLSVYRKGKGQLFPGIPDIDVQQKKFPQSDALQAEITAFLTAIAEGKKPIVTGEDGRNALQIAQDITHTIQESLACQLIA